MTDDAALKPTPNRCALPRRFSDFATFGEALDYAAQGVRGLNFHDPRGNLTRAYPFAELREDAHSARAMRAINDLLRDRFGVQHVTVQIDTGGCLDRHGGCAEHVPH